MFSFVVSLLFATDDAMQGYSNLDAVHSAYFHQIKSITFNPTQYQDSQTSGASNLTTPLQGFLAEIKKNLTFLTALTSLTLCGTFETDDLTAIQEFRKLNAGLTVITKEEDPAATDPLLVQFTEDDETKSESKKQLT